MQFACYFRACPKNHSRNLHTPLCGIFCPNSVAVAHQVFESIKKSHITRMRDFLLMRLSSGFVN